MIEQDCTIPGESRINRTILIDGLLRPAMLDEAMIHAVVHGFYDAIRTDALLGPVFTSHIPDEAWPAHLARMCDFWSATLLRTERYHGRPLAPHLAMPDLEHAHFERWLTLFSETVDGICPPDVAALFSQRAMRIAHSFRLAMAFHHGQDSTVIEPILVGRRTTGP